MQSVGKNERMNFIIIKDGDSVKRYAIWHKLKVIGYCEITESAAEKANGASNAEFYFRFDKTIAPEKYE